MPPFSNTCEKPSLNTSWTFHPVPAESGLGELAERQRAVGSMRRGRPHGRNPPSNAAGCSAQAATTVMTKASAHASRARSSSRANHPPATLARALDYRGKHGGHRQRNGGDLIPAMADEVASITMLRGRPLYRQPAANDSVAAFADSAGANRLLTDALQECQDHPGLLAILPALPGSPASCSWLTRRELPKAIRSTFISTALQAWDQRVLGSRRRSFKAISAVNLGRYRPYRALYRVRCLVSPARS